VHVAFSGQGFSHQCTSSWLKSLVLVITEVWFCIELLQFKDEIFLVIAFGLAEVALVVLSFSSGFTLPRLHFCFFVVFCGFFL